MNLNFNSKENDFFKAIGITKEDEETFIMFKRVYYAELADIHRRKKLEGKMNDFQLRKHATQLSSYSKMLESGLKWFKDHKREDQLIVLLLADLFFRMATTEQMAKQVNKLIKNPVKGGLVS